MTLLEDARISQRKDREKSFDCELLKKVFVKEPHPILGSKKLDVRFEYSKKKRLWHKIKTRIFEKKAVKRSDQNILLNLMLLILFERLSVDYLLLHFLIDRLMMLTSTLNFGKILVKITTDQEHNSNIITVSIIVKNITFS